MPTQIMEIKNIRWSNPPDGENLGNFFLFVGRDRLDQEHEFCISRTKMMEFHLECFQQLFASLSDLDGDLSGKLQSFLTAYQTLAGIGPEVSRGIQDLNLQR